LQTVHLEELKWYDERNGDHPMWESMGRLKNVQAVEKTYAREMPAVFK
jgi:hypothetical protein